MQLGGPSAVNSSLTRLVVGIALLLGFVLAVFDPASAQPPHGYYAQAQGLTGNALRQALHNVVDDHQVWSYDDAHHWVDVLDQLPSDTTRVRLIYSRAVAATSTWPGYNREHLWPQSMGARRRPARSDMHHIFAADANVNSSRGNKPFDDCPGNCRSHPEAPAARYTSEAWEPPDVVKGDIARALFYMDVRYEGDDNEPDLELGNEAPTSGCDCMGQLTTLLAWHGLDPVDDTERNRNNRIFTDIQGNRNPFIDHPEWVQAIWGGDDQPTAVDPAVPVRLQATHPLGVPLHTQAGGGAGYQRVADGTVAQVLERALEGRWLRISLPDSRVGWISRRYVGAFLDGPAPD